MRKDCQQAVRKLREEEVRGYFLANADMTRASHNVSWVEIDTDIFEISLHVQQVGKANMSSC